MVQEFDQFDYYKCSNCGFTLSKTHIEMSFQQWIKLNSEFHHFIESSKDLINQPPYLEQAFVLKILQYHNIISLESAIDYAGGYGTLSKILMRYFNINLNVFDPFINNKDNSIKYIDKDSLGKYKTLFNSALFEHLFTRKDFDEINNLVDNDGCMILHTVICENIPKDANWFYMEPPVHCAFHTNKSMSILMKQWGFVSSLYSPSAKFWVLFKKEPKDVEEKIQEINRLFQIESLIYKKGFVDYWKGF